MRQSFLTQRFAEENRMEKEKIKLPIHSALIPVFYQNFHCLAQDCRDSCCVDWRITFNKKDYLRLRRLDAPALRERLEQSVRRERKASHDGVLYGKFDLDSNHGRCPFLESDGLCAIQRTCGEKALPEVCRKYPRKICYTPAAKEYSLSPSCEGVLQQLWDLPDGVEFVEDPLPKAERRDANISQDENLTLCFAPVRGLLIDILQNRAMSLTERMLYLGITVQRLQNADWTGFDPDSWVEQTILQTDVDTIKGMAANIAGNRDLYLMQNLKVLRAIANAGKSWAAELRNALEIKQTITVTPKEDGAAGQNAKLTTNYSRKAYADALAQFQAAFSDYEYFFENLMVALALYMSFPSLDSREALWKSYVSLCNLYSFYRFASILGCKGNATKERLFHMIVMASRATIHNRDRLNGFLEELFQHDSSTLAHMAILIKG